MRTQKQKHLDYKIKVQKLLTAYPIQQVTDGYVNYLLSEVRVGKIDMGEAEAICMGQSIEDYKKSKNDE